MKKTLCTLYLILIGCICLVAEDYIQYEDLESGDKGYWKIPNESGTIRHLWPFLFGEQVSITKYTLYSGYVIKYQKSSDGLSLEMTENAFLRLIELAPGKYSLVSRGGQATAVIDKIDSDWGSLQYKDRKPYRVKWVTRDREPAGMDVSTDWQEGSL